MWPAEIWHRFPSLGWLPELHRARSLSSMRPKRRLLTSESIVGNWPFLVKHPRSQPPHHHTCAPTPELGTVLVSHPRESGTVLVSHRCATGTVLASGGMHWSAPSPGFRPFTRTGRLVRALARIPDTRADESRTARQAFQAPPQRLGRGRTSGAGRVAQSEFRGMRGAQARREGGAVRAPAGREFAALPRRSDERPSRE